MQRRNKPFWQMPWWEWLILLGSLSVIFAFCWAAHLEALDARGHHFIPESEQSAPVK